MFYRFRRVGFSGHGFRAFGLGFSSDWTKLCSVCCRMRVLRHFLKNGCSVEGRDLAGILPAYSEQLMVSSGLFG